jgi:DNA-binding CsgD family transcriptional regulator
MLVKKSAAQKSQVFFSVSSGATISTLGFLAGWAVILVFTYVGYMQVLIVPVMLAMAFILVAVVMLFFPQQQHHDDLQQEAAGRLGQAAGSAGAQLNGQAASALRGANIEANERALFWMRVDAVAKLYKLSNRERDVLGYLAKGRNASYIQKELVVSPHTAKSHIYNIYRKLDIHSQQKLMDFVEEYPVELAAQSTAPQKTVPPQQA